ncbi:MAG: NusG domain II-containing protein [Lachnospira pectinoschiza]
MTDADCPDKLCVKTGMISKTGETIVCLPHRVVVEIIGAAADDSGVDSIVR